MPEPDPTHPQDLSRRDAVRRLMTAGLSFALVPTLVACSTGGGRSSRARQHDFADVPDPSWPTPRRFTLEPERSITPYSTKPLPSPTSGGVQTALPAGVRTRASWAGGDPVPTLMDRMTPIDRLTIHHDGMTAFTSTNVAAAQTRIEAIRSAHRGRGWGDIGYHYVIDPAGRIWEGRPLGWQGAHVKDQNPGNLGICMLGNYERQRPTNQQLHTLEHFVADSMRRHAIPLGNIYTHRELAPTACPGQYLQPRLVAMRENTGALARV